MSTADLSTTFRSVENSAALDIEWVAQVSLLRPGFLRRGNPIARRNPGLKSETWATHSMFDRARKDHV
jgi:hypothetical protein